MRVGESLKPGPPDVRVSARRDRCMHLMEQMGLVRDRSANDGGPAPSTPDRPEIVDHAFSHILGSFSPGLEGFVRHTPVDASDVFARS